MGLLFLCITILTILPISYGEKLRCTQWNKNSRNTAPSLFSTAIHYLQQFIPKLPTDSNFDFKSLIGDYERPSEDLHMHITDIIYRDNYPIDTHEVETSDGYLLTMFRILGGGKKVVFLMHELFGSSDDYVTPGIGHALVYELLWKGYDVWLGNARGNVHSNDHVSMSRDCIKFWDFSWDDIGRKDLPAMIDYVLNTTNQTSLQYIGYSQGTTSFFVLCSERPEYNEKISMMIALAPVAWVAHTTNPLFASVGLFTSFFPTNTFQLFGPLFGYELLSRYDVNPVTDVLCNTPISAKIFCNTLVSLAFGFNLDQVNASYLPRVYDHVPAGISAKQLLHYGQGVISKKFRQYDYGREMNLRKYGSISPPDYPVHKITTRVVIIQGDSDNTATNRDVNTLVKKLPNFRKSDYYKIPLKTFAHFDFIVANDVKKLVHDKVVEFLESN